MTDDGRLNADRRNFARSARKLGFSIKSIQEDMSAATGISTPNSDVIKWTAEISPKYNNSLVSSSRRCVLFSSRFKIPSSEIIPLLEKHGLHPLSQPEIDMIIEEKESLETALLELSIMIDDYEEREIEAMEYMRRAVAIGYTYSEMKRALDYCDYSLTKETSLWLIEEDPNRNPVAINALGNYIWMEKEMRDYVRYAIRIGVPLTTILFRLLILGYDPMMFTWGHLHSCLRSFMDNDLLPEKFEMGNTSGFICGGV